MSGQAQGGPLSSALLELLFACMLAVGVHLAWPTASTSLSAVPPPPSILSRPRYAQAVAWHHVRQELLKTPDAPERRRRFDGFIAIYGEGYRHGVRAELAAMGARKPYAALLAELGGPTDAEPVEMHALGDRIDAMELYPSTVKQISVLLIELTAVSLNPYDPIDRMIAEANDYLAIACMKRLMEYGEAHDDLIRRYIDKRLGTAEHHGGDLRKLRTRLDASR